MFGKKSIYRFNDVLITQAIKESFLQNQPRIQITITGRGVVVYKNCFVPDSFVGKRPAFFSTEVDLILYGNQVEKNIIKLELRNMPTLLRDAERIDLAVVAHKSCL